MSTLTEARRPFLLHPAWKREDPEIRRLNRNGWIVVLIAALLLAILVSFARRADPETLANVDGSALID